MSNTITIIGRAEEPNSFRVDTQELVFELSDSPSEEWSRLFEADWNSQSGPKKYSTATVTKVRFELKYLYLDVRELIGMPQKDSDGQEKTVTELFMPWLREYAEHANRLIAKRQAEDKARQAKEAEAAAALAEKLRKM